MGSDLCSNMGADPDHRRRPQGVKSIGGQDRVASHHHPDPASGHRRIARSLPGAGCRTVRVPGATRRCRRRSSPGSSGRSRSGRRASQHPPRRPVPRGCRRDRRTPKGTGEARRTGLLEQAWAFMPHPHAPVVPDEPRWQSLPTFAEQADLLRPDPLHARGQSHPARPHRDRPPPGDMPHIPHIAGRISAPVLASDYDTAW